MNFKQRYSHVYIYVLINNWAENKYTPCDPAWLSPALRSGVYLRGQDTTESVISIHTTPQQRS